MSDNNALIIQIDEKKEKESTLIEIYSTSNQCKIIEHTLNIPYTDITSFGLSGDGMNIWLKTDKQTHILTTKRAKPVLTFSSFLPFAFSNLSNYLLYFKDNSIVQVNRFTGKEINTYQYSTNGKLFPEEIKFSANDDFFTIIDKSQYIYLYRQGKEKPYKRYAVKNIFFRKSQNNFVMLKQIGNTVSVFEYQLPFIKKNKKILPAAILREIYGKKKKLSLKAGQAFIDNTGSFLCFEYLLDGSPNFFIYNLLDKKVIRNLPLKGSDISYSEDQNNLIINDSIYNFYEGFLLSSPLPSKKSKNLFYDLNFSKKISSNNKGIIVYENEDEFQFRSTYSIKLDYENKLYVYHKKGIGTIDLNQNLKDLKINWFCKEINFTEDVLMQMDSISDLSRFNNGNINLDGLTGKLNLDLLGVNSDQSILNVDFRITDSTGSFINGAASELYKRVWCDLKILGPDEKPLQPDFIKIKEIVNPDQTNAISLVIDQSGSIGEIKNKELINGIFNFIDSKSPSDLININMFDHRVVTANEFNDNPSKLIDDIKRQKYKNYLGGTAILDAINRAINQLKNVSVDGSKYIILFTDGEENSSLSMFDQVLYNALLNNIKIFTLGYGRSIDPKYLSTISDVTGGKFFEAKSSIELEYFFSEIYNQTKNKYTLSFPTEEFGKYEILITLCPPEGKPDTLALTYNKSEIKINPISNKLTLPSIQPIESKLWKNELFSDSMSLIEKVIISQETIEEVVDIEEKIEINQAFEELTLPTFYFDTDKDSILNRKNKELKKLIDFLVKNPEINLSIDGHTDSDGTPEHNLELSKKRTIAVKNLIISYDINSDRLITRGYGDTKPLVPNTNAEAKAKNRRVEFSIQF